MQDFSQHKTDFIVKENSKEIQIVFKNPSTDFIIPGNPIDGSELKLKARRTFVIPKIQNIIGEIPNIMANSTEIYLDDILEKFETHEIKVKKITKKEKKASREKAKIIAAIKYIKEEFDVQVSELIKFMP